MKTVTAKAMADMKAVAAARLAEPVPHSFTELERSALEPFFTNTDRKLFFIHGLPETVVAALLAMYSRLKNPRGLRGHFVDNMVPFLSASLHPDLKSWSLKETQQYLKRHRLTTLDALCAHQEMNLRYGVERFLNGAADPEFMIEVANSGRVDEFLTMWLDTFGHKSIARTVSLTLCVEECSVLTAKSLEWARPGAGYIELSTRYVDFSGKSLYPVWDEVGILDPEVAVQARHNAEEGIRLYRELMGERLDGPFPAFLRSQYGDAVGDARKLEAAVLGESCDVLGNLLPCATLTQVGMGLSGEAFPQVLKHLVLDGTPENLALADVIVAEARLAGVSNFVRHWEPTPWECANWRPLRQQSHLDSIMPKCEVAARTILAALDQMPGIHPFYASTLFEDIFPAPRGEFDKLPRAFETVTAMFDLAMSFRGWRDVHRQGFCMHQRALVTPELGFFVYPKVMPPELMAAFISLHGANRGLSAFAAVRGIPPVLLQYGMAMGNLVRYQIAANLREWEFCNWQRTKWAVNDEVRTQFLWFEYALRSEYPWWKRLSRADLTQHYVFARGAKIALI